MDLGLQLGLPGISHVTTGQEKTREQRQPRVDMAARLVISQFPKRLWNNFERLQA